MAQDLRQVQTGSAFKLASTVLNFNVAPWAIAVSPVAIVWYIQYYKLAGPFSNTFLWAWYSVLLQNAENDVLHALLPYVHIVRYYILV